MSAASTAALTAFEQKFAKEFGEGRLTRRKKKEAAPKREVVSTGSLTLDHALGVGGLVRGRCYESWGPASAGKSTVNLLMAAQQQQHFPDRMVGWIDVERTFDEEWAVAHGVDVNRLWLAKPKTAEEVSDQVRRFLDSGLCSFVTVDSIGALISEKEIEKDAAEATVGNVAKIVTRMIRMAAPVADDNLATFHVINQVRAKIGGYGADTMSSGGFALQHGTTAQLTFKATGEPPLTIGGTKDRQVVGKTIAVQVSKNKLAPPLRTAQITLKNQATDAHGPIGIDLAAEAFSIADRFGFFDRAGAFYTLPDGTKHQGAEAVRAHLRSTPELVAGVRSRILSAVAHTVVSEEDELGEGINER
jgi:recombination protein RecA